MHVDSDVLQDKKGSSVIPNVQLIDGVLHAIKAVLERDANSVIWLGALASTWARTPSISRRTRRPALPRGCRR